MTSSISTNYRELAPSEVDRVAEECRQAWQDPAIPGRQYERAVKGELEAMRNGYACPPYQALIKCMRRLPIGLLSTKPKLLDVGASAGYYSEVLKLGGFDVKYTGLDFSKKFKEFARILYPDIDFDVADARHMPYHDDTFDIVINGACIMHCREYEQVIRETARVARRYAIFHRTPIFIDKPTSWFLKEGYGVPMLEAHFNQIELLDLFKNAGLYLLGAADVFWDQSRGFGHRSFILEKAPGLNHVQV